MTDEYLQTQKHCAVIRSAAVQMQTVRSDTWSRRPRPEHVSVCGSCAVTPAGTTGAASAAGAETDRCDAAF